MRDVALEVTDPLCGTGEGAVQLVSDVRNVEACYSSAVAGGASTIVAVCPGEGGVGGILGESDNLSIKGREGQGDVAGSHSARHANSLRSIETI